jgi:hypothetical protein
MMKCQWNSADALANILQTHRNTTLVWVWTKDDRLILPKQTKLLQETRREKRINPERITIIELPNGGHNGSVFVHMNTWLSAVCELR